MTCLAVVPVMKLAMWSYVHALLADAPAHYTSIVWGPQVRSLRYDDARSLVGRWLWIPSLMLMMLVTCVYTLTSFEASLRDGSQTRGWGSETLGRD